MRCEIFEEFFNVPPSEQEFGVQIVTDGGSPQHALCRHVSFRDAVATMQQYNSTSDEHDDGFYVDYGDENDIEEVV